MLLHTSNNDQVMEKNINFAKIKFHSNEILNDSTCNLNWNALKRNGMQIGTYDIENILVIVVLYK